MVLLVAPFVWRKSFLWLVLEVMSGVVQRPFSLVTTGYLARAI